MEQPINEEKTFPSTFQDSCCWIFNEDLVISTFSVTIYSCDYDIIYNEIELSVKIYFAKKKTSHHEYEPLI